MSKDVKWMLSGIGVGLMGMFFGEIGAFIGAGFIVWSPLIWLMWRMNRGMNAMRQDLHDAGRRGREERERRL